MTSREFHLGDILSVTTGRLLSPRHIDGVFDILNFLTGDNLFTHQFARAQQECEGPLKEQLPDLAGIVVPDESDNWEAWLAEQVARYGETHPVQPLADGVHAYVHPVTELARALPPGAQIVAVVTDGGDPS